MIHDILSKYEFLFNGTLSTCKYKPIYVELHPDSNPCHAKLYPFPRAHKSIFYLKIVKGFDNYGYIKRFMDQSGYTPPLSKQKNNGRIRFLSDSRKLNHIICRKQFLIPKIQYIMLNIEGFIHTSLLYLNIRYYQK